MQPLSRAVVPLLFLLIACNTAYPDNIQEVKELPQDADTLAINEAEASEPQAREGRCIKCSSGALTLGAGSHTLGALQAPPGAVVHTSSSFEGCSSEKGCAGIKVKDGKVIEKFGNLDSFQNAAFGDKSKEFSYHSSAGNDVFEGGIPKEGPFWWANENSPFKNAFSSYEKFSKTSSSNSDQGGAGGAGGAAFSASLDLSGNPFLNGDISKLAAGFTGGSSSSQGLSSGGFGGAQGGIDLSNNPYLNGKVQPSGFQSSSFESSSSFSSSKSDGGIDLSKNPFLAGAAGFNKFGAGQGGQSGGGQVSGSKFASSSSTFQSGQNGGQYGGASGNNGGQFGGAVSSGNGQFGSASGSNNGQFGGAAGNNGVQFGVTSGTATTQFGSAIGANNGQFNGASGANHGQFSGASGANRGQFSGASGTNNGQFSGTAGANNGQFSGTSATGQFGSSGTSSGQFGAGFQAGSQFPGSQSGSSSVNKFTSSTSSVQSTTGCAGGVGGNCQSPNLQVSYTGSSPSPFTASTGGSGVNQIQGTQKTSEYDYVQQQQNQQNIDELYGQSGGPGGFSTAGPGQGGAQLQQTCAGQGYVCVHKAQCNNGVVNTNGAGILMARTKKQYCNTNTEICCRIEIATVPGVGVGQGSLGVGSATFGATAGSNTGSIFGSGTTAPGSSGPNTGSANGFGVTNSFQSSSSSFESSSGNTGGSNSNFGASGANKGSNNFGSTGTTSGVFGTSGTGSNAFGSTNSFGSGSFGVKETSTTNFANRYDGSTGIGGGLIHVPPATGSSDFIFKGSNKQTNFIETTNRASDSFSAGSQNTAFGPGSSSGLKPGIPYLPPVDVSVGGSNTISSTSLPPTRPYNPPSPTSPRPTPRPYSPAKPSSPTYYPSTTNAPGYLPPTVGEQSIHRLSFLPGPKEPEYTDGSLILSPNREPRPKFPPQQPAIFDIPAGCAAALKCTPIEYCTAEGVISNTTVILTKDQESFRVPLTDCRDIESGTVGKCCRDPTYTDPWPTNQLGKWVPGVFGGDDGAYKPDGRGQSNVRPSPPPFTGSTILNNFRTTPKPNYQQTGESQVQFVKEQGQYGQGQHVTKGVGQTVSQGFGQTVTQGQGQYQQNGQVQYGQAGQVQNGQRGPGQDLTQGQGQIVTQGQGQQVTQGFRQQVTQGQGQIVTQGQGQIGQRGQGQIVTQGQGLIGQRGQVQTGTQNQGHIVTQGLGHFSQQGQGQGQINSQGQGHLVTQGQGQIINQGQGAIGQREQGQIVTQGQGKIVSQGQGQIITQGQGQYVQQGQGQNENVYAESVQRVFLQPYSAGGQCGILRGQKPYGNRNELEVDFAEIPWQAMVLLATNKSLLCGGVITRPDVVLTSAACVEGLQAKNVLIKGGEWKLGIDDEPLPFQIVQVQTILRHPGYQRGSLHNDVAALVLSEKLRLANNIQPICLPGSRDTLDGFYNGAGECIVTGWGKQVLQAHLEGSIMHSLNVSLINPGECQAKLSQDYPHLLEQYDENSCACGQPTNPINNICRVDIGSALACTTGDSHFVLRGVYSWDSGCQAGNQLAAFYKFDLEWYEWALGLSEGSGRFTATFGGTAQIQQFAQQNQFVSGIKTGQFSSGIKGGVKGGQSIQRGQGFNSNLGQFSTTGQFSESQTNQFGGSGETGFGKFNLIGQANLPTVKYQYETKPVKSGSFSASFSSQQKEIFQTQPKIISYTTKPEIITYTTKPQIITYTTKPKIISYTTKPQIVTYTTKPQIVRYETSGSGQNLQYAAASTYNPAIAALTGNTHALAHGAQCKCLENGKK